MNNFPDIPSPDSGDLFSVSNTSPVDIPVKKSEFLKLLDLVQSQENIVFKEVELVFVDEDEIRRINNEFLKHDYVTDIITFHYDEDDMGNEIEATLYCCAPRIVEQSSEHGASVKSEFLRVFVHGLIHLAGYDDQSDEEKSQMRQMEDNYLEKLTTDS